MKTKTTDPEQTAGSENISLLSIIFAIWKQRVVFCLITATFMGLGAFLFKITETEHTVTFSITTDDASNLPMITEWNALITLLDFQRTTEVTQQQNGSTSSFNDFHTEHKIDSADLLTEFHVLFSKKHRVRSVIRHTLETERGLSGDLLERATKTTESNITIGKIYKLNAFSPPNAMTVSIVSADPSLASKIIRRISKDILSEMKSNLTNRTDSFVKTLEKTKELAEQSRNSSALVSVSGLEPILTEIRLAQKSLASGLADVPLIQVDYDYPSIKTSSKRLKLLVLFSCLGLFIGGIISLVIQTIRQNIGNMPNSN